MKVEINRARAHLGRFLMFSAIGVVNTAADVGVYAAALFLGASPGIANIVSFAVANPLSYVLNGSLTFRRDAKAAPMSAGGYGKFLTAHLASLAISTGIVVVFAPTTGPILAKLGAVIATVFINYTLSALVVFPDKKK